MNRLHTDDAPLRAFEERTEALAGRLEAVARTPKDVDAVRSLIENFRKKTADFYRENRKLNIGVVGQVKAGKSSFLNTLLFDGKDVLPKASTPKTATLTRMEYAEENVMEIEYYAPDEWAVIEENAAAGGDDEIYTSARELVKMVRTSGLDPRPLLETGTESRRFASYEELLGQLNAYVGEDGKVTPLVKAVTLYLHNEAFRGLSIVDTPGLNDPITSRTMRTREFMELCDVVFFLSQSSSFLDNNDWELLSAQLPQKGVKRLALIASKYDSGVRDVLRPPKPPQPDDDIFGSDEDDENFASNIPDACAMVGKKLKKRAANQVERYIKDYQGRGADPALLDVIRRCASPVLVSAMAFNMARKPEADYSEEERSVANWLKPFSLDLPSDLRRLGNMEAVERIYQDVAREKETILLEKAEGFVPTATAELKGLLDGFRQRAENHIQLLEHGDKEKLAARRGETERQMNSVRAALAEVFGDLRVTLEEQKGEAIRNLRRASSAHTTIKERTGSTVERIPYTVSDAKWWNPFSWGKSHTEYRSHRVSYRYCLAADAAENLNHFSVESVNRVEAVFSDALRMKELRRKLLNVIVDTFDTGSESYDAAFFRLVVEQTVNALELPLIHVDLSEDLREITGKFTGEITSADQKNSLSEALSTALSQVFHRLSDALETEVRSFKASLDKLEKDLGTSLLKNLNEELDEVLAEYEQKEKELGEYQSYRDALERELTQL